MLIDCEEDRTLRAVLVGVLREVDRDRQSFESQSRTGSRWLRQAPGGGTVAETEAGDGGAAYGVEVRLNDGRVVEVELDENFDVIGQEEDEEGKNERQGDSEGAEED